MKHLLAFLFVTVITPKISFSQEVKKPAPIKYIFDPAADPKKDVQAAVSRAKASHKNVLVIVGGDWNYWCRTAYNDLVDSLNVEKKMELALVNFSSGNKNAEYLTEIGCPKNQGYPIFIVLDETGKKIHAQDTDPYKSNSKSYNMQLLTSFVLTWTRSYK